MPITIIEELPYYDHATTVKAPDGSAPRIKPRQIVLLVSVTEPGLSQFPPETLRFPVVLDIGFNDNFLIRDNHLNNWAGLTTDDLYPTGLTLEVRDRELPLHDADLWIHPNLPGFRDQFRNSPPFQIPLNTGICVSPIDLNYPRLPLLGMLALERGAMLLELDSSKRRLRIQSLL